MITAGAQDTLSLSGKDPYQQLEGRYGANEGICLFEDSTFLLYGYATAVFGYYRIDRERLFFYPDKPDLFQVYGTQNKSISKGIKINFVNFEGNGRTFFQMDSDSLRQVFNDGANCFDAPFVLEEGQVPEVFLLASEDADDELPLAANAYLYEPAGLYNDFMIVYAPPKRMYEPFSAALFNENGQVLLRLSDFATEKGYFKNETDQQERKQWEEILGMKEDYKAGRATIKDGLFANRHYNIFWPDMRDYDFDKSGNVYVSKLASENEAYFRQNAYNDNRYLHRFVQLVPKAKSRRSLAASALAKASIFYTVCEAGTAETYRYKDLDRSFENTDSIMETTAPVPSVK